MQQTIVIVDDRATNRNIFSRLAATVEDGILVRSFADPLEALTWLEDNPPDLVISDYKMPKMDGAAFIRRIRERPWGVDVPTVVITVYEDRSFRVRALEAGATDFLQAPVDHYEFVARARNLLKLRRQQHVIRSRARSLERELADSERSLEAAMRESRDSLAQVIDTVPALISAADRQGRLVFVNAMLATWSGISAADVIGKDVANLFGPEHAERSRALDRQVFETGEALAGFEETITDPAGARHVFLTTKAPLRDAERSVTSVLTTCLDITDRKVAEVHLRQMAHHDTLTDLPNRALLRERLERELALAERGQRMFALHFLDLDRFKAVNDAFGHHLGDRLLQDVARRLHRVVRAADTVARLGGDEFAILQPHIQSPDDASKLASRVVEALAEPFDCDGRELTVGASIGITLFPRDAQDAEEMLRRADMSMYRAKSEGRNGFRFFSADMERRARDAVLLDADLRHGLRRDQFVLHYQPQVSLRTGRIVGVEALLRWRRPGWGLLAPSDFLALSELNGLINPIGVWVLREACAQAARWQKAGLPPLRMAVNLSPTQFRRSDIRRLVVDSLAEAGLDPHLLDLELTESALMEDADAAAAVLRELKDLGIHISIDDFGTGYSSLNYIRSFPVDRLKIDQAFIRNIVTEPSDLAIARSVINLAHSLGLQVVAEGVETADQYERLAAEGCDEIQGYFLSRPLPAAELGALISRAQAMPLVGGTLEP